MSGETAILRTKLHIPRVTGNLVSRDRLLQRLTQHQQRPLSLVFAAAGYGKTTLISNWLATVDRPGAWVSLDKYDDDLTLFLTYFIAAIQTIFPETGQETLTLLKAPTLPPLSLLSRSLTNELGRLTAPFILVLDDLHVIREPAIHDLLNELLRYPPRVMHLVISTRRDPPLPITQLRARAQVTEIRSQELRFTTTETAVFLQQMGLKIDDTTAADLAQKTEGWVTGLRLSALSFRHRGAGGLLTHLPENIHYVTDYLVEETLLSLEPAIRDFLLKTCILDRLSGPLCDTVTGLDESISNGQAYLEWLYQQNLFIIPLDDQQYWYRYHHLFQEILQNQLQQKADADDIAALHSRASTWFAENDFIDEAIRHALAAGNDIGAAQIVEQNRHKILDADRWHILKKWLTLLPDKIKQQRPQLMLARAWVHQFQLALPAIVALMDAVEPILGNETKDLALQGEVHFFRGIQWFFMGQGTRSLECLSRAQEQIPAQHHLARGLTETYIGLATQMTGQKETAVQTLQQQLYYKNRPQHVHQTRLLGSLVFVHLLSGELTETALVIQQTQKVAQQNNNRLIEAWCSYLQATVHYYWNELEQAVVLFAQAVNNRYIMNIRSAIDTLVGLTLTYQVLGQSEQSAETMNLLLEFARQSNNPANVTLALSCQARLALLRGDVTSAIKWLQPANLTTDTGIMFSWLEVPRLTHCRVLIAQGTEAGLREALELLQNYRQVNEAQHNICQLIDILLLQAQAHHKQGQMDESLTALEYAVTLGFPGGFIRPFVEVGSELANGLKVLRRQGITSDYIEQILNAFENDESDRQNSHLSSFTPQPLVEPLTDRELDVLELLAQRFSNKEIAAQLFISPLTVKKHTINIYQKLGVKNRRLAVSKATALKLVSAR